MSRRGRPPKIGPEEQLRNAMHLFWRKGYYDTSVVDLVSEAGLNRAAVCAAYGGKKALFEKTLEFYEAEVTAEFLAVIEAKGASLAQIQTYLHSSSPFWTSRSAIKVVCCATPLLRWRPTMPTSPTGSNAT